MLNDLRRNASAMKKAAVMRKISLPVVMAALLLSTAAMAAADKADDKAPAQVKADPALVQPHTSTSEGSAVGTRRPSRRSACSMWRI